MITSLFIEGPPEGQPVGLPGFPLWWCHTASPPKVRFTSVQGHVWIQKSDAEWTKQFDIWQVLLVRQMIFSAGVTAIFSLQLWRVPALLKTYIMTTEVKWLYLNPGLTLNSKPGFELCCQISQKSASVFPFCFKLTLYNKCVFILLRLRWMTGIQPLEEQCETNTF